MPVEFSEDHTSRLWLVRATALGAGAILKRWGLASLGLSLAAVLALTALEVPHRVSTAIVAITAMPWLIAVLLLVLSPMFLLPQSWSFDSTAVRGRGVRQLGAVRWEHVKSIDLSEDPNLKGYRVLSLRWSSFRGLFGGTLVAVISPSVSVAPIRSLAETAGATWPSSRAAAA